MDYEHIIRQLAKDTRDLAADVPADMELPYQVMCHLREGRRRLVRAARYFDDAVFWAGQDPIEARGRRMVESDRQLTLRFEED